MRGLPSPEPDPVGELLSRERKRLGLTVEQVARRTRLSPRHLRAVEAGRFDDLPPQPYLRGLLGAYAAALGLDGSEVVARYEASREGADPAGAPRGWLFRYPAEERFNWRDWTIPALLAAGLAAAAATGSVIGRGQAEAPRLAPVPTPVVRVAVPPPPPEERVTSAEEEGAAAGAGAGVRLLLRSEGATWVEAAADGAEAKRYEVGPGQSLELSARERLGVALGDAGLVRITYGERELGFIGYKGETKRGLLFPAQRAAGARVGAGAAAPVRADEPAAGD